jgi:ABC-type transport system involved in multi-copper enzyme maturation permease subunit
MAAKTQFTVRSNDPAVRTISHGMGLRPFVEVLRWELRRALASRATWVQAALLFVICVALLGFSLQSQYFVASASFSAAQTPSGLPLQHMVQGQLSRNSLWGFIAIFPITLLEFGVFLPFVTADGVSLDLKRRTHELLMTTNVPSWAFVWGRFLARMLIAFGMAGIYLLAILVMGVELHIVQPVTSSVVGSYVNPALDVPGIIAIWAVIVLPPIMLLGSISFALGLLLPRRTSQVIAGMVFAWFAGGLFLPAFVFNLVRDLTAFNQGNPPAWWTTYENWNPINTDAGHLFLEHFLQRLYAIVDNPTLSNQAIQLHVHALEQQMPDLTAFVWPHLAGAAICLLLVFGASLTFRRFREVMA